MGYNVAIDGPAGAGKSTIAKAGCERKRIYICRYGSNVSRACCLFFGAKKLIRMRIWMLLQRHVRRCRSDKYSMNKVNSRVYLNGENITSQCFEMKRLEIWLLKYPRFRR